MAVDTYYDSRSTNRTDIVFFFGAGAETSFNLPSGEDYTRQTMLTKRNAMYDALKTLYSNTNISKYASYEIPPYRKEFLFQSQESNTFCGIVLDAADKMCGDAKKNKAGIDSLDKDTREFLESIVELDALDNETEKRNKRKEKASALYSVLVTDENNGEVRIGYSDLLKSLSYHGAVEQDFSSLVDSRETGVKRFWRLINYFWSAYFSITLPLLEHSSKYGKDISFSKNKYSYVIDNIKEITEYLYSDEYAEELELIQKQDNDSGNRKQSKPYYSCIKQQKIKGFSILTTNYTPFIRTMFRHNAREIAFLAGEINLFEKPQCNDICTIDDCINDFYFPYMLTQAYVKPIIGPRQLREYKKALEILQDGKYLVVIGYSFCKNDNHICAIIREFLYNRTKKMIYCQYCKQGEKFDEEQCLKDITEKLKIYDDSVKARIIIVKNDSSSQELISNVTKLIQAEEAGES